MKVKTGLIYGIMFFLIFISIGLSFCQGESIQGQTIVQEEPSQIQEALPEVQWVWGEVASTNINTKQIVIKYLDYETDSEKEITVNVDDKTVFENVKSLEEIKPLDAISVDYTIDSKGANIARNINVEKPEGQGILQ